mgnify:CR=1 FL=1
MSLEIGKKAPGFSLADQDGKMHSLADYSGKKVAVYFYPKDDTPGCTAQGCSIRDNFSSLAEKGIIVLGISKDSVESHKKFSDKFGFNFPILSDPEGKTIGAYGAWKEKSMYGKTFLGIARMSVLIDEKGKVVKVIEKASPAKHAQEIIEGFGVG